MQTHPLQGRKVFVKAVVRFGVIRNVCGTLLDVEVDGSMTREFYSLNELIVLPSAMAREALSAGACL